ncbi:hypothetical protein niasHT_005001 [Heterodera trifolii]|uniref:Uncharacterized protein n=1 Tax=Heterodera trifolii TaxID=157864 RepID=A0ABD2M2C4_9BILA
MNGSNASGIENDYRKKRQSSHKLLTNPTQQTDHPCQLLTLKIPFFEPFGHGAIVARSVRLVFPVKASPLSRTVCLRFDAFSWMRIQKVLPCPSLLFRSFRFLSPMLLNLRDSSYDGSATEGENWKGPIGRHFAAVEGPADCSTEQSEVNKFEERIFRSCAARLSCPNPPDGLAFRSRTELGPKVRWRKVNFENARTKWLLIQRKVRTEWGE